MCPAQGRSYPSCPTGYVYDYMEECRCVAVSVLGELELEIALAVTFLSLLATILSLVQCYRRGIGLFRCSYKSFKFQMNHLRSFHRGLLRDCKTPCNLRRPLFEALI